MTSLNYITNTLKVNKPMLEKKYGLSVIAVFGSYSRGEQNEESDIDILVDFDKPIGIEFIDLAGELEILLKHKVDLVSLKGIKPSYFQVISPDINYV